MLSLEKDIHFINFWWVRGDEITVVMITWISHHRRSWIIMVVMCAAAPRLIWGPRGSCPGSHPQICKSCLLNIFQKEWKIIYRHIHESRDISLLLDYFGFCTKWLFPHFSPLKIMPQATKKWIYIFWLLQMTCRIQFEFTSVHEIFMVYSIVLRSWKLVFKYAIQVGLCKKDGRCECMAQTSKSC